MALKPIASDSPSATIPRITGRRSQRRFAAQLVTGWETSLIRPSGRRTATAQLDGPRIITPSRTAWPPTLVVTWTAALRGSTTDALCLAGRLGLRGSLAPAEALDASARVDELLLARVERVAVRADLDVDLALGRSCGEVVPARAGHMCKLVGRVDVLLHALQLTSERHFDPVVREPGSSTIGR